MDVNQISVDKMRQLGRELLYQNRDQWRSFESASTHVVQTLFDAFQSPDGRPAFALLRVFRATTYKELHPELQSFSSAQERYFLALMATQGLEATWCDRRQSQNRRAIPINAKMSPMFKGVAQELGFRWEDYSNDSRPQGQSVEFSMMRYFYVPNASQSNYITDQEGFVKPYGIQSVLAIGSPFVSGAAYTLIGFTRVAISPEQAQLYSELTPFISTLLAGYDAHKPLWDA